MAAGAAKNSTLLTLWRERLDIVALSKSMGEKSIDLSSPCFIDNLVHATYNGSTANCLFAKHLKDGLSMEMFPPVVVIDCLTKLALGKKLRCYSYAVDTINLCINLLRNDSGGESATSVCKTFSRATYWLLENTIEVYKLLYTGMKDASASSPDPEVCVQVIGKSQDVLNTLVCKKQYDDMTFIGKLLLGEEDVSALQVQMRELLSFQLDKISSHTFYGSFQKQLQEFMKLVTRFLNATPKFTHIDRPRGQIPSQSLHAFLQFQVLVYLSTPSLKIADILDSWLKLENIPVDQVFVDLLRFTSHNILIRKNPSEILFFTAFMFVKLPAALCHLDQKYKLQNGNHSILFSACQQFLQLSLVDLDATLGCDTFKILMNQCQVHKGLDNKQCEELLKLKQTSQSDGSENSVDSMLNKLILSTRKADEVLKNLSVPVDENKEKVLQEMLNLFALPDLLTLLITFAASDKMDLLIGALLRINTFAVRCPEGTKDLFADVRADLFNNSFLMLTYIHAIFEDKVFIEIQESFGNSFFMIWKQKCINVTSRKMYTQSVLDNMLDILLKAYNPATSNAKWDEYCWSVGMIVKELTQAHLRRHITTDTLQKICEGFKNKRPALCVCAMVWLCAQYKSMPVNERARTVKIINLFKRPHVVAAKAAILTPILNKYSAPLDNDLQAATNKSKSVAPDQAKPALSIFSEIMSDLVLQTGSVHFDDILMKRINKFHRQNGFVLFAESLIKLIIESGKEQAATLYEDVCACLILMDPVQILHEIFTRSLKTLFHGVETAKMFADPQGLCLAKCLSKAFSTSLIIFEAKAVETPRPAKMTRVTNQPVPEREKLINAFSHFLQDAVVRLSSGETSAVSAFILNIIEQTGMATSTIKPPIKINQDVASNLLLHLPSSITRDALTFLCDLSTITGQQTAANFLLKQNNTVS